MRQAPSEFSLPTTTPFLKALSILIERQPELTVVGTGLDGLAAIELAEELSPDAVVIDLHMPQLDGVCGRPGFGAIIRACA